jgi:eukaryotic-like serine/threonine-protein kinase
VPIITLSLVLYECLAGRVPFLGETDADTALARLQRDPTDLGHLRPTLPIGLVNLIHRTLARNPAHRPQTGADLRAALLAVDTSPPAIDGTPAELPERLANPPKRALGAGPGDPGRSGAVPPSSAVRSGATGPAIPGEPRITGQVPVTRVAPATPAARDDDTPRGRNDTPPAIEPIRGRPARHNQQRFAPSLIVVGILLVVALVTAGVLLIGMNRGDTSEDGLPGTTVIPGETPAAGGSTVPAAAPVPAPGAPTIATIIAYDPDGTNRAENDTQAFLAIADGSVSTSWPTECYSNQYLGGKRGVGLILGLSGAMTGTLAVESMNGPYQIDVYAASGASAPADLAGWTQVGDTASSNDPGVVTATVVTPATYLLVWLKELGQDEACTEKNPYRGRLGEISFTP